MLQPGFTYAPEEVLPHRHEMLLLETVDAYGADWVRTGLTVRGASAFCEEVEGVPAWVGLEYMAQAVGVYSGIERRQQGERPCIGLLIGTRRYDCETAYFGIGSALEIRAQLELADSTGVAVFTCQIACAGACLARADLKAFRPADIQRFLATQP